MPVTSHPCCCVFVDASPSEAANALAAMLTTLSSALTTIEAGEAVVTDALAAMQLRARRAVASTRDASEAIVAALTRAGHGAVTRTLTLSRDSKQAAY